MMNIDKILKEEPEVLEKMGEVASKIAYYNFDWRYITLVIFHSFQYTLAMSTFFKYYKQSAIVKLGKFVPRQRFQVPQFVIFGRNALEIVDTVLWMKKVNYDNAGKYVIVCTTADYDKCDEIQIFAALMSVQIVNVVYMRGENNDDFLSFSYNIIQPGKCINSVPYKLDIHNNCTNDDCFKSIYQEKLNNFNECSLVISTFEQPPFMYLSNYTLQPSGGDGDILRMVASALNATLEIKVPDEGNDWGHYENGNWTGSLGDVFNDRVHASVCSVPLTSNKYANFQISFVYNSMDIVWSARLPMEEPAWQKLLNPLQMNLRITLFFTFVFIVIINSLMKLTIWRRIREILNIGSTKFSLLFYSWALFLGMPLLKIPTNRQFLLVVYIWIWSSFVIKNAYQATLISSLKKHDYLDYFTSFVDVLKGKYPYGGLGTLRDYYADDAFIYDNWIQMDFDEAYDILDKISDGNSDFAIAFNKEIIIEHLLDHNGKRHLQIIPEKIVNSPTVMFFKKFSVIAQPISRILSILVEAGFCEIMHARYLRHKKLLFKLTKTENRALTFDNVKSCILLLAFGWSLSFIFFIAEAYCGRLQDN